MGGRRATATILTLAMVSVMATAGQFAVDKVREAKEAARAAAEEARAAAFAEMQPSSGTDAAVSFALNRRRSLLRLPAAIWGRLLEGGIFFDSWTLGALPADMDGQGPIRLSSLSLPGADILNMPFRGPTPNRQTMAGCQTRSGLLGTGLLGRGVWQLDYPAGRLTRLPEGYMLPEEATLPLTLDDRGGLRTDLDFPDTGRISAELWFGTPLPLLISQELFIAIGGRLPKDPPVLQGRLWEAPQLPEQQAWRIGFLPRLELGDLVLKEVPSLVDSASRDVLVLGGRLLSGSRVTFDLATARLHLERIEEPELEAWPGLEHGLVLGHDGHRPILSGVWQGSPAFKAGFRAGDRLISINRRSFADLGQRDFCAFLIVEWPSWGREERLTISAKRDGTYLSGILPAWNALYQAQAAAGLKERLSGAQSTSESNSGTAAPR